ncbi:MAG: ABC transporter ATP-binding protein [Treponema sp.]|jgi:putative ABC transport system ATP-binding protein|nr:ABC transporter ATP-binding protein [Treponema sp.]
MLLDVRELTKVYQREGVDFQAVDHANMAGAAGDFIYITGRSGCGKSTFLNMIVGLLKPSSGSIVFNGQELHKLDDRELSFLRNTQIGYIPQGQSVLANFSVLDNVLLPFYLYQRKGDPQDRARTLLEQVGIFHLANAYPAQLSGGELRRVAIARSLINDPCLLVADEPTGDLDPETADVVIRLFEQIAENGTLVLMSTHHCMEQRPSGAVQQAKGGLARVVWVRADCGYAPWVSAQ